MPLVTNSSFYIHLVVKVTIFSANWLYPKRSTLFISLQEAILQPGVKLHGKWKLDSYSLLGTGRLVIFLDDYIQRNSPRSLRMMFLGYNSG